MEKPQHSICDAIRMAGAIANVIDWTHAQKVEELRLARGLAEARGAAVS